MFFTNPFEDTQYAVLTASAFAEWMSCLTKEDRNNSVFNFMIAPNNVTADTKESILESIISYASGCMYCCVVDQRFDKENQYLLFADHISVGNGPYVDRCLCRLDPQASEEETEELIFRTLQDICGKHRSLQSDELMIIEKC